MWNPEYTKPFRPDWLLIYLKDPPSKILTFVRTGTHSDLFD